MAKLNSVCIRFSQLLAAPGVAAFSFIMILMCLRSIWATGRSPILGNEGVVDAAVGHLRRSLPAAELLRGIKFGDEPIEGAGLAERFWRGFLFGSPAAAAM